MAIKRSPEMDTSPFRDDSVWLRQELGHRRTQVDQLKARNAELEEMGRAWRESDEHKHANELRDEIDRLTRELANTRRDASIEAANLRTLVAQREEWSERHQAVATEAVGRMAKAERGRDEARAENTRLRGLLARCAPALDDLADLRDNGLIVIDDNDYAALQADTKSALAEGGGE